MSEIKVLAYLKAGESGTAISRPTRTCSTERKNKPAIQIWPLEDLIKAERRVARGSLRPYNFSTSKNVADADGASSNSCASNDDNPDNAAAVVREIEFD